MRHFLRPLGFAVALLAAVPALAADPEMSEKEKLDKILREVQDIRREVADLRTSAVQTQKPAMDMREIQHRLENLEQAVERLSAANQRIAGYFNPSAAPASASATGTIRIQNRFGSPATVFINGLPYAVPAFEERRIAGVPIGNFTYQVQTEGFGVIQPNVNRPLTANEIFTISINPPPAGLP